MSRLFLVVCAVISMAAGCRGKKSSSDRCVVVERAVREIDGSLEVSMTVRWTVAGKNYRLNKPMTLGARFDPDKESAAALEKRFAPGTEVGCAIDPAQPTRVDLSETR